MIRVVRAVLALLALSTLSCTTRDPADLLGSSEAGVLVVDAVLIVDQDLPTVFVSRTGELDAPFADGAVAEQGALVTVSFDDQQFDYVEDAPGRYVPIVTRRVGPRQTYELSVVPRRGGRVSAVTTTPARLTVADWVILDDTTLEVARDLVDFSGGEDEVFSTNELIYAQGLLEARFPRPAVPAFQVAIFSLEEDSDFVIDPDFFDEADFEDLDRVNYSPPLAGVGGTLRLPWFAIFFEGRYKIKIFAIDDNWYDLIRSSPSLGGGQGFGGTAGDSFERPIFNVQGGIGLFGAASVDSVGFRVLPRP